MVRFSLKEILELKGITNISELSRRTGLTRNGINKLLLNPPKMIELETIDKLCSTLNITPNDLLVFAPDGEFPEQRYYKITKRKKPKQRTKPLLDVIKHMNDEIKGELLLFLFNEIVAERLKKEKDIPPPD